MTKMNPGVKAQWLAALRSGEYKQAQGVLRNGAGHCCLGVMCDLFAKQSGISHWTEDTLGREGDALPSDEVCDWAGMPMSEDGYRHSSDYDPVVKIGGVALSLSEHNDKGRTFAEIADAIEEQL